MYVAPIYIMGKGLLWIGAIVIVLIIAVFLFNSNSNETGTINLYLTDAPAGVNVSSVIVTLSDIEVHYAGAKASNSTENDTQGEWSTIVTGPVTHDLMTVKDAVAFLGSQEVKAGKYTQIRLNVESAKATIDGKEENLTIPSGTVRIVRNFEVVSGEEIKLTLDFNAEDSIISQGNNQYKMQPTIKLLLNNERKE